ncbi:MAG: cytochrome c biogenesis protein, partial [candidate division KSB1 bacterium]|nr:cytochrome c biogenesis protein [candidate division KSB1 bacterium]
PIIIVLHLFSNFGIALDRELPALLLHEIVYEIHVIVLLFAYSAFAISFIASVLYLLLSHELQKKSTGLFYRRLPSLAFFESLSNRAINIGLVFLTVGIALGLYEASKIAEYFLTWDAKFLAVGLTWLIYFWHWASRLSAGWQGRRAALVSLFGFGWLMFSFLIVSLAFTRVHSFH